MAGLAAALIAAVIAHGYIAIFLITVVEEAGVPSPIPGDAVLLFAGYLTARGSLQFLPSLLVIDAAALMGATTLYAIARHGGRPLLRRHGHLIHLREQRLDQLMRLFNRLGPCGPGFGRLIPGLRIYTSALAGLASIGYLRFAANVIWACTLWAFVFLLLGRAVGAHWNAYSQWVGRASIYLVAVAVVALVLFVLFRRH